MRDAEDRLTGFAVISQDITKANKAQSALLRSTARLQVLFEAMPQIAFIAGPNGHNISHNKRWLEYSGQSAAQAKGSGWAAALHPDDAERTYREWRAALAARRPYEIEHRLRRADGAYRCFLTRAAPVLDTDGAAGRWFGTCTDISDIVAARETLARDSAELENLVRDRTRALSDVANELAAEIKRREEAQNALVQAQKLEALGNLTSGVAHDFNNILASIVGGFSLLERRVSDPDALRIIARSTEAAERAAKLVAQLLSFARKEELRPKVTDPAALLRAAEPMIAHTVMRRVRCIFELDSTVMPIIVDPVRLETVLLNLAANARDAMPEGGRLTISVQNAEACSLPDELTTQHSYVRIAVSDTGVGMSPETLRRATEPFFTTKPVGKGTGLGLASAHGFAAQSGGTLRLTSRPGEGTTVELYLPQAGVLPLSEGEDDTIRDGFDESLHGDATILVVDDDDGVRPVTAQLLRDLGYRVLEAASAEAAEAIAHHEPIDMLVTDVVMPGASGNVLSQRLRSQQPDLAVLYITGFDRGEELSDAPVLGKPFSGTALTNAVLRGLGRMPSRRRHRRGDIATR